MTPIAYIGIGSNLGNRIENCEMAVRLIRSHTHISITKVSSWIETEPIGFVEQAKFINGAIEIKTQLDPPELLTSLLSIEKKMGRQRTIKWGPRLIDLDILLYGDLSYHSANLNIPHPEIKNRDFVRIPLLEINPSLSHYF